MLLFGSLYLISGQPLPLWLATTLFRASIQRLLVTNSRNFEVNKNDLNDLYTHTLCSISSHIFKFAKVILKK